MSILVNGVAGFIGANFVLDWIADFVEPVVTLDKLTYAGNLETLANVQSGACREWVSNNYAERQA